MEKGGKKQTWEKEERGRETRMGERERILINTLTAG